MQQPTFAQPERRSYLVPLLAAICLLIAAVFLLHRATRTALSAAIVSTEILPNTTVYKSDTIVLAPPQTTYTLFVVARLNLDNKLRQPVSLDDLTLTLTNPEGAELTAHALRPQELSNAELSFPRLKPLVTAPLLMRDAPVASGQAVQGEAVFSLAVPQPTWVNRKSAVISVTPYNLDPISLTVH